MTETQSDQSVDVVRPSTLMIRTAAFYADPRAATLLLSETVTSLVSNHGIQRAYVDLSTNAGATVAATLHDLDIPFESLEFGQTDSPASDEVRELAEQTMQLKVDDLAAIDANLVVIPAMADGSYIDFSPGTLPGVVLAQAEQTGRDLLLIVPPERGLLPIYVEGAYDPQIAVPERYERQVIRVAENVGDLPDAQPATDEPSGSDA